MWINTFANNMYRLMKGLMKVKTNIYDIQHS